MRALLFPTLIVALLASPSVFAGGPTTLGYANNQNIEPVLVQVNSQGKITDFEPAYPLSPSLTRLLRENLNEMIHTPAITKNGKPVAAQFVINVTLLTQPRSTGDYYAYFNYVSASAVPAGNWYWSHDSTGRLGLASRDDPSNGNGSGSLMMFNGTPPSVAMGARSGGGHSSH